MARNASRPDPSSIDDRLDHRAADLAQCLAELLVVLFIAIQTDDRAARAGEMSAGAVGAGNLDHAMILRRNIHDRAPQVVVGIHHLAQGIPVALKQCLFALVGQIAELAHRRDNRLIASFPQRPQVAVRHLTDLGTGGVVRHKERRKLPQLQRPVLAIPAGGDQFLGKVHVDDAFIRLDHAILQPGSDAQFALLTVQHERRQIMLRDLDLVELHQCPHGRSDDAARPRQAYQARHIRLKLNGKVAAMQGNPLLSAIRVELVDGGLDQTHAAVITVQLDIAQELIDAIELAQVARAGQDLQPRRLPKANRYPEVANRTGNRLSEVPIGRVADDSRACIGMRSDYHIAQVAD